MGGAQGRDAGFPRSAWLCRRFDGRRCGDHRRRREPAGARLALLDRPRRRPAVRAQGSQATFHPRANGPVVARPRRDTDRRRPGRKPDGLPPSARSDRATRRDGEGAAHPAAVCSGDGGDARARSLEGLDDFLVSFASAESLSKVGDRTTWTQIMRIQVEQHPTDHGMPMPRRLHFDGHRVDVLETLDQWCGPDYRYIKVRGYDGLYILRFDETRAEWHLTMFKRARAEGI